MRVLEGTVFHGLSLLSYCGGGAFGDVYYCEDITGRHLAVKIIWKQKIGNDWKRELQGVANYQKITSETENLLKIFHVEEDDECFFYTMEAADSSASEHYVPDTLSVRLASGPLRPEDTFGILLGIFKGVKTLHEAGFVHRDIKPENILFVNGKPKLGDIGLLSSLEITVTQVAGTLDFLPPEVRSGEGDASDRLSRRMNDLYALGKVMYCCVTGEQPQSWPTVPRTLPLTLPLKFFLRLSLRLCDRDQERRLVSLDDLDQEFESIERKLMFGETLRDKLGYQARRLSGCCRSLCVHLMRGVVSHWALSLGSALVLAGVIWGGVRWWRHLSELRSKAQVQASSKIVSTKTQTYVNERLGFQLTFPMDWSFFTSEALKELMCGEKEETLSPQEKKQVSMLRSFIEMGSEAMFYTGGKNRGDNIYVQPAPFLKTEFEQTSLDEFRKGLLAICQGELGLKTEIYDIRRITFKGLPVIRVELSHEPGSKRALNYLVLIGDSCVSICLTAFLSSYDELEREFLKILDTFRLIKKAT